MTVCPKCGAANLDHATACAACGSALPHAVMSAPASTMSGMATTRTRPTGVTILAVLYYVGAGLLALGGVLLFLGGAFFSAMLSDMMGVASGLFAAIGALLGIALILLAVLSGVTGWGLWTAKPWAWILAIVLTALNALTSVGSLVQGEYSSILSIAIAGFILWYLWQPGVKAYFGRA